MGTRDDRTNISEVGRIGTEGPVVLTNGGERRLDAVLRCLASQRRRHALYYLRDNGSATVTDLARQVVAAERRETVDDVPEAYVDRIASELHHTHLPKLADALAIEYDTRSQTVSYSNPPPSLETFLELAADIDDGGL